MKKPPRVTEQLIERARAIECTGLPEDVRHIARLCVLDWIGVTLAANSDPLPRLLIDEAIADGGRPLATIIGHSLRVAPLQAALVNGAASPVLDYDDGNPAVIVHGSASILPGLLALAEGTGANGADVIAAFVAEYETGCRVALLVQPGHYARGYHSTCTIGTVAAATACARLRPPVSFCRKKHDFFEVAFPLPKKCWIFNCANPDMMNSAQFRDRN